MKGIGIVSLFPSICLGVAFLCVNSVQLGSRENGCINSLNQAVEAVGADVEATNPQSAAVMPEAQPAVNQENSPEMPPPVPAAPEEIKVEIPAAPAEAEAPASVAPVSAAPQIQEKAAVSSVDEVINNLIDQIGALMAQKLAEQVHTMMQERVQMRLKTFIKDELKRIMESCPVDITDEIVEEQQGAAAPQAMGQAEQMGNEQMSYANQDNADMIGNL